MTSKLKKVNASNANRGLIKMIVIIVIALIILGYFGFNLRDIMSSSTVKDNLQFGKDLALAAWNTYLKNQIAYIWNLIVTFATPYLGKR